MKKKRNLYIIAFLCFITLVGVTIAYLQSTATFENLFNAGTYKTVTSEEFTSPTNWTPGDVTPKTITTTNEGTVPVRVRVKFTEEWKSSENNNLPLESNGVRLAILNLDNLDDWEKDGDYYYYIGELAPGDTTSSLLQSVTFNPEYQGDITCTTVNNDVTCEQTGEGYMGGTYKLTATTETVQSTASKEVWNLEYDPSAKEIVLVGKYSQAHAFIRQTKYGDYIKLQELAIINNDTTYYLKAGGATYDEANSTWNEDSIYYEENKQILKSIYGDMNEDGGDCWEHQNPIYYSCGSGSDWKVRAHKDGSIGASEYVCIGPCSLRHCTISEDGTSSC